MTVLVDCRDLVTAKSKNPVIHSGIRTATAFAINTLLLADTSGNLMVWNLFVHYFKFKKPTPFLNIMRKWNKICMSYDFEANEAQVAFNGIVSELVREAFKKQ